MDIAETETRSCGYSLACRDDAAKHEFWSCLALRECQGLGMRRIAALVAYFGSASEAVRSLGSWPEAGVPQFCAAAFKKESWRQKARLAWEATKNSSCGIVLWSDPEYPVWLRSIADPPPFLYFFGDITLLCNLAVAVVGMRACSEEGLKATLHITRGLSRAGVTIVSGMAKGIDRAAHLTALEGPGSSIGVLGAGIDIAYPQANRDLYEAMHARGLLLSEYPPAYGVEAKNFPVRNRIISGISRAVLVVEAALRSGSLNTANHALEQNRELMAVPGAVSASSAKGCQELVRRGAKAVFDADDVLRELVPLLADHVRQGLLARDIDRFQYPRPGKTSNVAEEEAKLPLVFPGGVPLRASKGTKGGASESRNARRENRVVQFPLASLTPIGEARANCSCPTLSGLEAEVYALVSKEPIHIDDICRALGQDVKTISSIIVLLEVGGYLARLPGMFYTVR